MAGLALLGGYASDESDEEPVQTSIAPSSTSFFSDALKRVENVRIAPIMTAKRGKKKRKAVVITSAIEFDGDFGEIEDDETHKPPVPKPQPTGGLSALLPPPRHKAPPRKLKPKPAPVYEAKQGGIDVEAIRERARQALSERQKEEESVEDITQPYIPPAEEHVPAVDDVLEQAPDRFFSGTDSSNIVNISASDLVRDDRPTVVKPKRGRVSRAERMAFTGTQRSRHQITWLLSDLKDKEDELDERLETGVRSKRETWGKYGWM